MSTLAVVEEILRETAVPMSVREIVERAGPRLPSKSKTPDTVVARDLSMDIKKKGEASLFTRTSPGRYTLRSLAPMAASTVSGVSAASVPGGELASIASSGNTVPLPSARPASPVTSAVQPAMAARKPAVSAPSSSSNATPAAARGGNVEGGGYLS
jgi:hypothetical protein